MVISLFKMAPKISGEILSSVCKYKKAMICLMEKICVFNKLHSGQSYNPVGCEVSVNESICIK